MTKTVRNSRVRGEKGIVGRVGGVKRRVGGVGGNSRGVKKRDVWCGNVLFEVGE